MCPPRRHHVTGGKVLNFSITLSPAHVNISNVFLVWTIVLAISLFCYQSLLSFTLRT